MCYRLSLSSSLDQHLEDVGADFVSEVVDSCGHALSLETSGKKPQRPVTQPIKSQLVLQ
jgi:hypothetical protein